MSDPIITGRLNHPLPTRSETATNSGFQRARTHPILGVVRAHNGIDIPVEAGTPIGAVNGGKIVFTGFQDGGAGNYVIVRHGTEDSGYSYSSAFHIQEGGIRVSVGDYVEQGDTIGLVGSTGLSSGNHLHFEYFEGGDERLIERGLIGSSGARRLDPGNYIGRDYLDRITIRKDDVNDGVGRLQERLDAMGYDIGEAGADGKFGDDTESALRAFQRDRGFSADDQDGIYGSGTRAEMAEAERTNFRRPGAPETAPTPEMPATETPTTEAPDVPAPVVETPDTPPASPTPGASVPPTPGAFVDTPGPFASSSMGDLLNVRGGTPMGALTGEQAYALGRAVLGDSVGADAFERVDRTFGEASGTFVTRMIALGRHEGGLDFGRQNPDPSSGYNVGTFQIGGKDSTRAESEARFERMLDRGIEVYETQLGGPAVDRDALTHADRDALAHVGYMVDRTSAAFRTPLPEYDILERMADPDVQGRDLIRLVHNDVQGGIPEIGERVAAMTDPQDGLRVNLAAVEARTSEPAALRAEPPLPVFSQGSLTPNSHRGPTYSPAVQAWQAVLQQSGQDIGAAQPDGVYGDATRRGTEALQREAGVRADGAVGPATWSAYHSVGAQTVDGQTVDGQTVDGQTTETPVPTPPATPAPGGDGASVPVPPPATTTEAPLLRDGDRGPAVTEAQTRLAGLGYDLGAYGPARDGIDGRFGPATEAAVRQFQRDRGLDADGVIGADTRAAMSEAQAEAQAEQVRASVPRPGAPNSAANSPDAVFIREADGVIEAVLTGHTRDTAGARQAIIDGTYGPGSGPLGATTAEDVQAAFDRFASGAGSSLSRTEASSLAPILDARARLVAEGIEAAPVPSGDGASREPSLEPAVSQDASPERASSLPDASGLRQTGPGY